MSTDRTTSCGALCRASDERNAIGADSAVQYRPGTSRGARRLRPNVGHEWNRAGMPSQHKHHVRRASPPTHHWPVATAQSLPQLNRTHVAICTMRLQSSPARLQAVAGVVESSCLMLKACGSAQPSSDVPDRERALRWQRRRRRTSSKAQQEDRNAQAFACALVADADPR